MLTAKEKRQKLISEAGILYLRNDEHWFKDVREKLRKLTLGEIDSVKAERVLKWVRECESIGAIVVKEQILKEFGI